MTFTHPLGLKAAEWRLIRDCMHAWKLVPNGHYLPATRWYAAAVRMIDRGYLTRAPGASQPVPHWPGWIVILITRENIQKYNADLKAAQEAAEGKSHDAET